MDVLNLNFGKGVGLLFIYTVVTGDTLRGIAERFGTTTRELLRLNELDSQDVLVPGLHLLVPGAPYLAAPYRVRSGDDYTSIALKSGVSARDFEYWTGLRETKGDTLKAGSTIYLPKKVTRKKTVETNGYLLPTGDASDANILRSISDLTYVCIFSYQVRPDGTLLAPRDQDALQGARDAKIAPLMTVTNFDGNNFNTELAHTVMSNPSLRRKVFNSILNTMRQKGFKGVNVDFEHMHPEDRQLYNQFIRELKAYVRSGGYSVSIAMGPKTSDDPQASWMGAFDYRTLGREVDFLMLMTYEWGWVGGPPMAVAPIDQVRAVLKYATSVIPSNKILMGMSLYGYDWPLPFVKGTTRASGISNNEAQNLALREQVPIEWDAASASPFFRYTNQAGENHIVWFDDALSEAAKLQLIYDFTLRGATYWVLGNEFPQGWYLLKDSFEVKSL